MNLLAAVVLLIIIAFWSGQPTTTIDKVINDSPAYEAGIVKGDEILEVDGRKVEDWDDLLEFIGQSKSKTAEIKVLRDGREMVITSQLEYDKQAERNKVGIVPGVEHNLIASVATGVKSTGTMTVMMYDIIKKMFTGDVSVKELSDYIGNSLCS